MFTGLVECIGNIHAITPKGRALEVAIESTLSPLAANQSVSHDGVCLSVLLHVGNIHTVLAVEETVKKSCLRDWQVGDIVNLERAMRLGGRLEGHIVLGHADAVATCEAITPQQHSWLYKFSVSPNQVKLLVAQGSIAVNGVSLTVCQLEQNNFWVSLIPSTYQKTNLKNLTPKKKVNIEYDVLGKYIQKIVQTHH